MHIDMLTNHLLTLGLSINKMASCVEVTLGDNVVARYDSLQQLQDSVEIVRDYPPVRTLPSASVVKKKFDLLEVA